MIDTAPARTRAILRAGSAAALLLLAAVWIGNAWSPSSYAIVLRSLEARDAGLVLGTPRAVRSDEWSIVTPLMQATVNNGFRRYNETSFYREDLRIVVALPLADWGLVFKPDQWLYPLVDAAYAYSFQHLVYIAAFLVGYALLFARIGVARGAAAFVSLALFFTAFVQFWWTTFAPNLAYFPWLLLALGIRAPAPRVAAFLWIAVVWMLGYFYPPIFIPLAIGVAAIYWSCYLPERGARGAALDSVVAVAACAIAVFYLRDYLAATWTSIYPGQRSLKGGAISLAMQVQQLWPTAYLDGFESRIARRNVCDASVVGTYYFLMAACFVDWRRLRWAELPPTTRRMLVAAAAGIALLFAWQSLPIPASVGRLILFDRILPQRTMFASGFLALVAAAALVQGHALRFSPLRLVAFCGIAAAGWLLAKGFAAVSAIGPADAAVVPVAIAVVIAGSRWPESAAAILAAGAALLGVLAFGPFNPIQSATPIFHRDATRITRALDEQQKQHPHRVLVDSQYDALLNAWGQGATLNGLGYRSASHVLLAPEVALWQRLLPTMDAAARDRIFNRTAQIVVRDGDAPELLSINIVGVPPRVFGDFTPPWFSLGTLEAATWQARGGHIDTRRVTGRTLFVAGWAPWRGLAPGQSLAIHSAVPLRVVSAQRSERPDVAAVLHDDDLRFGGFVLELARADGAEVADDLPLCLVARDALARTATLVEPAAPECGGERK